MNLSPVNFNVTTKAPVFKGVEKNDEGKTSSSGDLAAIKESIDKNTEALDRIGKVLYASAMAIARHNPCYTEGIIDDFAYRYDAHIKEQY